MYSSRRLNRLLWAVCILVATLPAVGGTAEPTTPAAPATAVSPEQPQAGRFLPSFRIRKLHLVRPDLIPYPLFYEVVC